MRPRVVENAIILQSQRIVSVYKMIIYKREYIRLIAHIRRPDHRRSIVIAYTILQRYSVVTISHVVLAGITREHHYDVSA